jgi:hypothetical protein
MAMKATRCDAAREAGAIMVASSSLMSSAISSPYS